MQKIGASCFHGCSSLERVELPESLQRIEEKAFQGCSALSYVNLPAFCDLSWRVFQECLALTEIVLPEGLNKIPSAAFAQCRCLSKIQIPPEVTEIESRAFEGAVICHLPLFQRFVMIFCFPRYPDGFTCCFLWHHFWRLRSLESGGAATEPGISGRWSFPTLHRADHFGASWHHRRCLEPIAGWKATKKTKDRQRASEVNKASLTFPTPFYFYRHIFFSFDLWKGRLSQEIRAGCFEGCRSLTHVTGYRIRIGCPRSQMGRSHPQVQRDIFLYRLSRHQGGLGGKSLPSAFVSSRGL